MNKNTPTLIKNQMYAFLRSFLKQINKFSDWEGEGPP